MNSEKYPREPFAALGISVMALFLLAGAAGAAEHHWPQALVGFGAPVLAYLLFPPSQYGAGVRKYGAALTGGLVVVGESFLWAAAAGPFVAASMVAVGVAVVYAASYIFLLKWQIRARAR